MTNLDQEKRTARLYHRTSASLKAGLCAKLRTELKFGAARSEQFKKCKTDTDSPNLQGR